jgi:hypothetical protein
MSIAYGNLLMWISAKFGSSYILNSYDLLVHFRLSTTTKIPTKYYLGGIDADLQKY